MTQGVCLCGAVRYEFTEPFQAMLHCHCSMCRKHHGAAFATFVAAPTAAFHWLSGDNAVGQYQSSERGARQFCRHCGSVAPMPLPGTELTIAPAGNLEGDPGIRPQSHIFVGSKAVWYTITDDLPQHEAYSAELGGGPGITRPAVAAEPGVVKGSCLCGGVEYEASDPLRMYHCHCWRCRRTRSAAHTTNLFVEIERFAFTRGEELLAQYKVPDARFFAVAFCTRCGGEAPRPSKERGIVNIPAATLDTDPGIRPQAHIFVGSKAPWFDITDALPQHVEAPPAK
jgi:hypothetical protein